MKHSLEKLRIFIGIALSVSLAAPYALAKNNPCTSCTLDTPYVHTAWQHPRGPYNRRQHYSPREHKYHGGRNYAKRLRKEHRNEIRRNSHERATRCSTKSNCAYYCR